jgi:hypothetical protein
MIHIENKIIILKLAGDSTNIYRGNKTLVISFSIINEMRCKSASGTYIVGIFCVDYENFDEVHKCLQIIKQDYYSLTQIEIQSKNKNIMNSYRIEKFLGGDWKYLAIILGINAANSNYFCLYCHNRRHSVTKENYKIVEYRLTEKHGNNRTLAKAQEAVNNQAKEYGYLKMPIFDFIEFFKVIPDLMHLFNRISGKLCNLFYRKLSERDSRKSQKLKITFIEFLKETCRISNPFSAKEDKDNDILKDFIGQEYWSIPKNINALFEIEAFKDLDKINIIMKVWTEFYEIYTLI